MTKHVKKNMKVAGEYRPRPTMRRRTLPSGAVIAYSAEVDQEQVLAMLAEKTAEANRRISMRLSAMIAFSSLPRFRVVNFPELVVYARQLVSAQRLWNLVVVGALVSLCRRGKEIIRPN